MNLVLKLFLAISISSTAFAQPPEGTFRCGEHQGEPLYCGDNIKVYYLQGKQSLLGLVSSGTGGFPGVEYEGVMCSSSFSDPEYKCPTGNTPWYVGPGLIASGSENVSVRATIHFDIKTFCRNSLALCRQSKAGEHMRIELLANNKVINRGVILKGWGAFNTSPNGRWGFNFDLNNQISEINDNFHQVIIGARSVPANSKIDVRISNTNSSASYYLHAVEIEIDASY